MDAVIQRADVGHHYFVGTLPLSVLFILHNDDGLGYLRHRSSLQHSGVECVLQRRAMIFGRIWRQTIAHLAILVDTNVAVRHVAGEADQEIAPSLQAAQSRRDRQTIEGRPALWVHDLSGTKLDNLLPDLGEQAIGGALKIRVGLRWNENSSVYCEVANEMGNRLRGGAAVIHEDEEMTRFLECGQESCQRNLFHTGITTRSAVDSARREPPLWTELLALAGRCNNWLWAIDSHHEEDDKDESRRKADKGGPEAAVGPSQ